MFVMGPNVIYPKHEEVYVQYLSWGAGGIYTTLYRAAYNIELLFGPSDCVWLVPGTWRE